MAAVASRRLVGTSWVLARLDDPTGSVSPFPSGEETLTFEATTVIDNHGNNAFVRVEPETIRFQMWVDDLVIVLPSRPPGLECDRRRFPFSVLTGRTNWTANDQQLVITKPGVGSATFTALIG